jgi:Pentapeptide repeats (9 copies)
MTGMWRGLRAGRRKAGSQRFTELFAKALDRLGDPRPALRVGALHLLELLGQDHPQHRRAIVDVICAYVRLSAGQDEPARLAAQRILTTHLRPDVPGTVSTFWPGVGLDLTTATLVDFDLSGCHIGEDARFDYAVFQGPARFRGTVFGGAVSLCGAVFHEHAWLERSVFTGPARFDTVTFHGDAWFGEAVLAGRTSFTVATFGGHAWFGGCEMRGPIDFTEATFLRSAGFRGAVVRASVNLDGATFVGPARVSLRGSDWNVCPPGWRVEVDPDNEAVGQLVWAGHGVTV